MRAYTDDFLSKFFHQVALDDSASKKGVKMTDPGKDFPLNPLSVTMLKSDTFKPGESAVTSKIYIIVEESKTATRTFCFNTKDEAIAFVKGIIDNLHQPKGDTMAPTFNDHVELVAKIGHEANRIFSECFGDFSSPPWHLADEHIRNSAIDEVKSVCKGATPRILHENWMKYKMEAGWVYGEKKSEEKKTHPYLVPYKELPAHQKAKNFLLMSITEAFTTAFAIAARK